MGGNGNITAWEIIRCAECEESLAYFPPAADIFGDDELELYCHDCALLLQKGTLDG